MYVRSFLTLAVSLLLVLITSCTVVPRDHSPITITYRVTGTASSANVSYTNGTNGSTRVKSRYDHSGNMTWEEDVVIAHDEMAYLTAQNNGEKVCVVAQILLNGRIIKSSESSGPYCVATVAARFE